jgi:hypothetical protein
MVSTAGWTTAARWPLITTRSARYAPVATDRRTRADRRILAHGAYQGRSLNVIRSRGRRAAGSPIICSQLAMLTPVWRRADYLFGGGRTSAGAARRCGLPALCAAFGL